MKTLAEWDAFVVSHSEEAYARFHSRLSRTRYPIRGIRIPILRKQAREIARGEDWRAFCDLRADSYELVMAQGLVLAQAKMRDSFRIDAQLAARAGRIAADKPIA